MLFRKFSLLEVSVDACPLHELPQLFYSPARNRGYF